MLFLKANPFSLIAPFENFIFSFFMFILLFASALPLKVVTGSLFRIQSAYSGNSLGDTHDYRAVSTHLQREEGSFWAIEPTEQLRYRAPILCNTSVSLLSSNHDMYLKITSKGDAVLSKSNLESESEFVLVCKGNQKQLDTDNAFMLLNPKNNCYLETSIEDTIGGEEDSYMVRCGNLSSKSIWKLSVGVYLDELESEHVNSATSFSDEL